MEIYADVLFALNYLMDLQILFLTALVSRCKIRLGWLTAATAALALYGTAAFWPETGLLGGLPGRLGAAGAAVWLMAPSRRLPELGKRYGILWMVTLAAGGGVTALALGTDLGRSLGAVVCNGSLYLDMDLGTLLAGIGLSYGVILAFRRSCVRNFSRARALVELEFQTGDRRIAVTGLVDTGCELTAPGGDGVVLVPRRVLGDALPARTFALPIRTAGGFGALRAFYPDAARCLGGRYVLAGLPAIAVTEEEFAADGLYCAVINPEVLREKHRKGGNKDDSEDETAVGAAALELGGEAGPPPARRRLLHRREREPAPALEPGGGGGPAGAAGSAGDPAGGQADPHRAELAAGGLYRQKV